MNLFITGGSRGIGHHILMSALGKGHNVAFTYRNPDTDVVGILEKARSLAPDALCRAYQLDVRSSEAVSRIVDQVIDDFDTVDAVVNNAGINRNTLAFSMSDEDWHDVLATNLSGPFFVIRQFLPIFLASRKGTFINISSLAQEGISGQANYSASKAGLSGLSNAIAKEYGQKGITSNVIVAGAFETDMTRNSMSPDFRNFWMQHCPVKRMGNLKEFSEVVLFLASDAANFINGQEIWLTGGLNWAG